jgi:hypothetical protein
MKALAVGTVDFRRAAPPVPSPRRKDLRRGEGRLQVTERVKEKKRAKAAEAENE